MCCENWKYPYSPWAKANWNYPKEDNFVPDKMGYLANAMVGLKRAMARVTMVPLMCGVLAVVLFIAVVYSTFRNYKKMKAKTKRDKAAKDRSTLGKENVAPAATQPQQPPSHQQPPQQVKTTTSIEAIAQRTEATPLNQKDNYSGGVESATKTFVEDQRLQSTSIHQTSSTQIRQQETKTTQHFEHTQHQQQEAVIGSPTSPSKSFFPQVKFPIQPSLDQQIHQDHQQQHINQSIQEQYQQTQFYQEHFKHPQFQQPQKPPHAQSLPPHQPFKHPELPLSQQPQPQTQFEPQAPIQQQFQPQVSPQQQFQPQVSPQQQFQPQVSPQQQFQPQLSPQQLSQPQVSPQQQFQPQLSPQQQFQPQLSPQQQFQPQPAPSPQPQFQPQPPPQQQFQPQQAPSPQPQFQPQPAPSPLPQFQPQPPPQQQFQHEQAPQPLFHVPKPQFQAQPEYKPEIQLPLQPPQPSIAPTFNAKAALLSSQLFASPLPFSSSVSGEDGGQEKVVSFEQSSDDKHFHQLKTEQTRQKTDNSEKRTFLREEKSFVREEGGHGQGALFTATDDEAAVDQKPSKPVSSIIQDLEEATRDFHRVADAMSASSVSKSIESTSSSLFKVTKFETQEATNSESHSIWRPTSPIFNQPLMSPSSLPKPVASQPSQENKIANIQGTEGETPSKNEAPKPPPKPIASRPVSAPPMDFNIMEFARENGLGGIQQSEMKTTSATTSSTSEFYSSSVLTGAYQPSPEAEENEASLLTRRRKMYTSSSFYEEPGAIYPTVEEQVELCRKIADSLSADTNKKSKGANMFYKRVKRSHKWVHESGLDAYSSDGGATDTELEPPTPDLSAPYIKVSQGPPKLKLIMAPRPIVDMQKLKSAGQQFNEHNVVSPDICMNIVRDLNSPCGRGAAIFAKRKQKAEEWVVDEEKVKAKTEARKASMQNADLLVDIFPPPVAVNPRVKLIKSPWEAAMESPIGSCDAAFVELPPVVGSFMAQSIIQAAEHKLANNLPPEGFDPSTEYHPPGQRQQSESIYKPVAPVSVDIYRPKAPKGWKGTTQESVPTNRVEPELAPFAPPAAYQSEAQHVRIPSSSGSSHAPRPVSFHDFNTIPRSWTNVRSSPAQRTSSFRPVKPPSTSF